MGEFEAAGELVTGGLLGRAMESRAGEGHGEAHGMCLNCGTALIGSHCHHCGQAGHVHRSLGAIGHEILHGVAHFEGKLWRTLPLLAWRPGDLTRRYIAGERARFVSPMALFLFSIFTMFAVFSIVGLSPPAEIGGKAQLAAGMEDSLKHNLEEQREVAGKRAKLAANDPERHELGQEIADLKLDEARLRAVMPVLGTGAPQTHTGWKRLDKGLEKARKNPGLLLYKLQANSYKFSWLLIPLSLPFVWVLFFWKRQYKLYDHTVFITYSIAFMSLLFIVITIGAGVGVSSGWLIAASLIIPFVHVTRQLKQAYQLRWWSAGLRAIVLTHFISIVVSLFLLILLLLGMVG
jgi:hypothetical protein